MDFSAMENRLRQLRLCEKSAVCLEKPNPDYVLHLDSQSSSKIAGAAKLAACTSTHTIRLYSRETLAFGEAISGPEKNVTEVKFSQAEPNLLLASSIDGTIRCWDLRQPLNKEAQLYIGHQDTSDCFLSFDLSCDGRMLCAGTEAVAGDCHLLLWDSRVGRGDLLGCYSESHQNDIMQVRFHPNSANKMATGCLDGLVCVFDLDEQTEDDALLTSLNIESSVSRIGWCGADCEQLYGITHTADLHVWELEEYDTMVCLKDVKEKQVGSQKVDYLVDCFQLTPDTTCAVAGTYGGGRFSLCDVTASGLVPRWTPRGDGHTDDVRCITWDQHTQTLVTGGEDAMLCLWKLADSSQDGGGEEGNTIGRKETSFEEHGVRRKAKAKPKMKMKAHRSVTDSSKPY